jgi:hypothetical protein
MVTGTNEQQRPLAANDGVLTWPLDREAFETWLKLQPADRFFDPGSVHGCPLACYLQATGLPAAWVGYSSTTGRSYIWAGSGTTTLPGWTYRFQLAILRMRPINGPQALEVLHGLPEEKGDTDEPAVALPGQHLAEPG